MRLAKSAEGLKSASAGFKKKVGMLCDGGFIESGGTGRGSKGYRLTKLGREFLVDLAENGAAKE